MNRYDTFWERTWALAIDGFILNIVSQIINQFFLPSSSLNTLLFSIVITSIPFLYAVLMVGKYGQTVGKMIMKVKVVDNTTEDAINYSQSFMREAVPIFLVNTVILLNFILFGDFDMANFEISTLGYILLFIPSAMLVIWSILEIVTMLFDERNRALHDEIANTVVIKTQHDINRE